MKKDIKIDNLTENLNSGSFRYFFIEILIFFNPN